MKNKKVVKNTGELSALVLKGFELVFFRRHLGLEKVVPEMAKVRNDYIFNVLSVLLMQGVRSNGVA